MDEFAELKKEYPDFLKDLISIARIGRSLGIHLILSTQKPSGIVNDQIWANSRFKVCMKVQEKQDSMEVLHLPDAAGLTVPGNFCLLCDGVLQKGQCGYAEAVSSGRTAQLDLLKETGMPFATAKTASETTVTDLDAVMRRIQELAEQLSLHAEPIWHSEPEPFSCADCRPELFCIARIDDFWHQKQPALSISPASCRSLAIVSMNQQEKKTLLKVILYALLKGTGPDDEIFLIDDWHLNTEKISSCPQLIAAFSASDQERVRNLMRHLEHRRTERRGSCHILIDDCSEWIAQYAEQPELLQQMLENAELCNTQIILFASRTNLIPHRILSLIQERIAVMNESIQDLGELFECSVRSGIHRSGFGLIRRDHMLMARFCTCSDQDLSMLCSEIAAHFGRTKRYQLPFLESRISISDYQGPGIALGKDINTYEWAAFAKEEGLLVLATYEDEQQPLASLFTEIGLPVSFVFNPEISEASAAILFLTLADYQRHGLASRHLFTNILYLGTGFHDQYSFTSRYRGTIQENQAVFYRRGRNQVIQIVQQE